MRTDCILVDFESVQPADLSTLEQDHFKVIVFIGASQHKIPFEVAAAIQRMGAKAQYVKISGNGPNALDFHIAFYIGQLAASDPTAYFHIVTRDTGFDPLIEHLYARKIFAARQAGISEIPLVKAATSQEPSERFDIVLDRLRQQKASNPRTLKTLSSTIAALFQKQISEDEVATLIGTLRSRGLVTVTGAKLSYKLAEED